MSLWQFQAVVNGYADAHSPEEDKGLDKQEIEELSDLIDGNN
jgi:hypothetical protein